MLEFVRGLQEELVAAIHLDATSNVRSDQSTHVHPHHCARPMCVSERFLETLRLLEHPSEGPLVCEAGPRGDAVSVSMCLERVCRKFETIHQPSAAEQLASSLALGKEHPPSMPRSRRADFPILLAIQYFVKPALLDDERMLCAALQAAPLARAPLRLPCLRVSFKGFPFLDSVYLRLPRCGVALIADHAATTLVADHAASCDVSLVANHATAAATAAKASALQAVGARALQEALAAELGARRCGLSAAAQRGASHVCSDRLSSAVYGTARTLRILAGRTGQAKQTGVCAQMATDRASGSPPPPVLSPVLSPVLYGLWSLIYDL